MTELLFTGAHLDPTFFFHSAMANIICTIIFGQCFNNQDPGFLRLLHLMNDISDLSSSFYSQVKPKVPWGVGVSRNWGGWTLGKNQMLFVLTLMQEDTKGDESG